MVKPPPDVDAFSPFVLKPLALGLLEENALLREEIARLKGLKGKPDIKPPSTPSGMDKATEKRSKRAEKRRRGAKTPTAPVEKRVIAAAGIPPGSRLKGYEDFTVQDLKIEPLVVCYRRERWLTPDGRTVLAPLPAGIGDHFGPEIIRLWLRSLRRRSQKDQTTWAYLYRTADKWLPRPRMTAIGSHISAQNDSAGLLLTFRSPDIVALRRSA